jgi:hypothetical protein
MNLQMDLISNEDANSVVKEGLSILVEILEQILTIENLPLIPRSFLGSDTFISEFFNLIERYS